MLELTLLIDEFVVDKSDAVVTDVVFVVLIVSVEFVVELLLLFVLFACVKLPLITFRGNGFGLIISTKKKQTKFKKKQNKKIKSTACKLFTLK